VAVGFFVAFLLFIIGAQLPVLRGFFVGFEETSRRSISRSRSLDDRLGVTPSTRRT
jgi:hypothetical protein